MQLKLSIEQLGQTYTLKPDRSYIVGSSPDCQIVIQSEPQEQSLRFTYDAVAQAWVVEALATSGMLVGDRPCKHEVLRQVTRIKIRGGIVFTAVPESTYQATAAAMPSRPSTSNDLAQAIKNDATRAFQATQSIVGEVAPKVFNATKSAVGEVAQLSAENYANYQQNRQDELARVKASRSVLSWADFSKKISDGKFFPWFYLTTGFRNTPWLRAYSIGNEAAANFNSFDGYIIPNFQGSVDEVVKEIEDQVSSLARYESTNSSIVKLTDGHIADSKTQSFLGIELFPIVRDPNKGPDYRRFCVTSYNRVRNYLLVEKYGSDLFVSWITRFEPMPIPAVPIILLCFSLAAMLPGLNYSAMYGNGSGELFFLSCLPTLAWINYYVFTPWAMGSLEIIPKAANSRFISFILAASIVMFFWFLLFPAIVLIRDSRNRSRLSL